MPNQSQWAASRARQKLYASLRKSFASRGYEEVETHLLVPAPGMEPHITAFEARFLPETDVGTARTLYLHTSPEYAMKRLLADGSGPIFQICKVFRNGEVSASHNPEFTMLEFYRPGSDYHAIMDDTEAVLAEADPTGFFARRPYERISVRDAVKRETGIDIREHSTGAKLAKACEQVGVRVGGADSFDDVFFHLFLQRVEHRLGHDRPSFLIEYPASMASLSKLKASDPVVAERVELYAKGKELANGFSELTDAVEQRRRLVEEREWRRAQARPVYPLDENFLGALAKMPPSSGIAVGLDRVLMLIIGAEKIEDVLLFPAAGFLR